MKFCSSIFNMPNHWPHLPLLYAEANLLHDGTTLRQASTTICTNFIPWHPFTYCCQSYLRDHPQQMFYNIQNKIVFKYFGYLKCHPQCWNFSLLFHPQHHKINSFSPHSLHIHMAFLLKALTHYQPKRLKMVPLFSKTHATLLTL